MVLYTQQQLNNRGITDLKKIAKEKKIKGFSKWKKADKEVAIQIILAHQVQHPEDNQDAPVQQAPERIDINQMTYEDLRFLNITKLKKLAKSNQLDIPNLNKYKKADKDDLIDIIAQILNLSAPDEADALMNDIMELYTKLQVYSEEDQRALLAPFFTLAEGAPVIPLGSPMVVRSPMASLGPGREFAYVPSGGYRYVPPSPSPEEKQFSPDYTQISPQYDPNSPAYTQISPQYDPNSPAYTQISPQYTDYVINDPSIRKFILETVQKYDDVYEAMTEINDILSDRLGDYEEQDHVLQLVQNEMANKLAIKQKNQLTKRQIPTYTTRGKIQIIEPKDLANVLKKVNKQGDEDIIQRIPLIQQNVQKCLGLI